MLTQYVNNIIQEEINENKNKLDNSKISTIHPEIFLKYSSVNVFLGKQGTGKTFTLYKELLKISLIESNVHLIIIATKDNRKDETYELFKNQIKTPIITVSYNEIVDFINNIIFNKLIYEYVKDNNLIEKIKDEQVKEILNNLYIDSAFAPDLRSKYNTPLSAGSFAANFNYDSLQEIIIFDDAAYQEIIMKNNSEIINMIHQARHYKLIFCFCVQGIKTIPLSIKEQMATLLIFPGFINQKLPTIFQQSGITEYDYEEFKDIYRSLKNREYILVDCQKGTMNIINGNL